MIECRNLKLAYPGSEKPILQQASFKLEPRSFHFLLGASGTGKSSLLRILALTARPTAGDVFILGKHINHTQPEALPFLRRKIGMVFQDARLLDHLTVEENVALPLKLAGIPRPTIRDHVDEMLGWIGMKDHAKAMPSTLSGGQKQRVAIARAVINKPDIILADEPTGNLDPQLAMKCMYLFEALHKGGATLVVATHDEGIVARMGHPVLRLNNGTLQRESGVDTPPGYLA